LTEIKRYFGPRKSATNLSGINFQQHAVIAVMQIWRETEICKVYLILSKQFLDWVKIAHRPAVMRRRKNLRTTWKQRYETYFLQRMVNEHRRKQMKTIWNMARLIAWSSDPRNRGKILASQIWSHAKNGHEMLRMPLAQWRSQPENLVLLCKF